MIEKKLLIVLGSMGRGGAERVISLISDYMCRQGWKVYIALLLFNKIDYELNENVTVVNLTGEGQSRIKRLPGWIFGIRRIVKEVKPDSILSFAARINVIVQIACYGLKQKIVVSERNDPYMDGRSKGLDLLTRFCYPKAKSVVFQTMRASKYFDAINLRNKVIIPNPITVKCLSSRPEGCKIVTVGRLTKQKNQKMLIDAFFIFHKKYPESELHIYGDGELRGKLTDQIGRLGLEKYVYIEGNVPNIHEQISDATMFILPSDYEGLSNALLEALMMRLPCISTACAGSDEYIVDGESGLLVPIGDKDKLVAAMFRLMEDTNLRQRCREGAAEVSKKVESEIILDQWCQILI